MAQFMDAKPTSDECAVPAAGASSAPTPTAPTAARFWRGVFSEADGSPSFSRIATAVVVAFAVGWTSELVRLNHALPDFGGMTCFVGTLYGVNKLSAALGRDR
jgi:hypothetical protein